MAIVAVAVAAAAPQAVACDSLWVAADAAEWWLEWAGRYRWAGDDWDAMVLLPATGSDVAV